MKRTDITALFPDATEEQIKALMDINCNYVNREKGKAEDVKKQLAEAQATIEELNKSMPDRKALEKATKRAADLEAELNGIKEAEQLEGVDPEEMVQKVVGALQGESVTAVPALTNESAIMKTRGVTVDMDIARRITEAVLKESAELDGVVPAEMIQKVLSALRPM